MLKKQFTEEDLRKKVSEYDIFYHYFGFFEFNKCYPSVFRKDLHPSTGFYVTKDNVLVYNDLTTGEKLAAVQFVARLYNISYHQAVEKIAKDFGILEGVDNTPLAKVGKYKRRPKEEKVYSVTKGIWRERELDYWKDYYITKDELIDNFIYPCRELLVNHVRIENPKDYLRFIYFINHIDKQTYFKVYSPHDPVYKWSGPVPRDALFGLQELPFKSDTLIITKGQKDRLIWKKYFTDVIAPQTEAPNSIGEDICRMLTDNYENIYVNFDADEPGKKGSQWYTDTYGWKWINVPNVYYEKEGIKDFADLVKAKGLIIFEKYLKWKKLL